MPDSGSTHSFISTAVVKAVKPKVVPSELLSITIADGSKMFSTQECPEFSWHMNGYLFKEILKVLELSCYDMVLGTDWLKKRSPL